MKKLAIITTHPIQYNAPLFKLLTEREKVSIKVFYTWGEAVMKKKFDPGFQKEIQWDIPLLEGYDYEFSENRAKDPGTHHFFGINNPDLIQDVEAWKADAVLVFGWNFYSHLKTMKYFKGKIPVYFIGDSTVLHANKNLKHLLRVMFLKVIYRYIDFALYVGKANKDYFKTMGVKENNLFFLPHVIDNQRFNVNVQDNVRYQLTVSDEAIVFLFAGKLEPVKNIDLLIDAFEKLSNSKLLLWIVGNGILENKLKEKCLSFQPDLRKNIIFWDFQNQQQMPLIYNTCDVFVLPSKSETWGLSVNEAMACGKPVIVSDNCGCHADLVENGKNGFVFQSDNIDSLEKVLQKIADKKLIEKMSQNSRNIISEWNLENKSAALEKIILCH